MLRCRSRPSSECRSSAGAVCALFRSRDSRRCVPPLVSTKLMPLAQSSELPPPSATIESTRSGSTKPATGFDHRAVGVFAEVVIREHRNLFRLERSDDRRDMTGSGDTRIGHQKRSAESEVFWRAGRRARRPLARTPPVCAAQNRRAPSAVDSTILITSLLDRTLATSSSRSATRSKL